jgi:hypothetical protein
MPGKTHTVVLWLIVSEIIQQQEWIEIGCIAKTERATKVNACAFKGRLRLTDSLDRAN